MPQSAQEYPSHSGFRLGIYVFKDAEPKSTICSIGTTKTRSASSSRGSVYMPVYGSPLTQRTGAVNPEGEVE
jgi:hypothetical protein